MLAPGAPNASSSRVRLTDPSMEFSMGTTPKGVRPERTASTTSGIVVNGSAARPGSARRTASEVNVPSGPRKATRLTLGR